MSASGAVAVGVFDGLHLGHLALIERAIVRAQGGRCTAITFDPHPDVVLAREFRSLPLLTPLPEKQRRLAAMGVDLHVIPFTRELAALEPEVFVARHIVEPFGPRWLVVGRDFALGRGRAGNVDRLAGIGRTSGFEVEAVPLLSVDGAPVTSTRIRTLLLEGRVDDAARLLGRRYAFAGLVVHGEKLGRKLGYPTANLRLHDEQQLPALGIYAVWARIEGELEWRAGAMSLGVRPTFDGQVRTLEVHLLDWDGDLYGRDLHVELVSRLRDEERFPSVEALVAQMGLDVMHCREILSGGRPDEPKPSGQTR